MSEPEPRPSGINIFDIGTDEETPRVGTATPPPARERISVSALRTTAKAFLKRRNVTLFGASTPSLAASDTSEAARIRRANQALSRLGSYANPVADIFNSLIGRDILHYAREQNTSGSQSLEHYAVVVLLRNPNGHNYTHRVPIMSIGFSNVCVDRGGRVGNSAPPMDDGRLNMRPATDAEVDHFVDGMAENHLRLYFGFLQDTAA